MDGIPGPVLRLSRHRAMNTSMYYRSPRIYENLAWRLLIQILAWLFSRKFPKFSQSKTLGFLNDFRTRSRKARSKSSPRSREVPALEAGSAAVVSAERLSMYSGAVLGDEGEIKLPRISPRIPERLRQKSSARSSRVQSRGNVWTSADDPYIVEHKRQKIRTNKSNR